MIKTAEISTSQTLTNANYPAYKDSGIDWLGEIPAHWEIKKLKTISSIFGRIGYRGYTVADIVSENEGVITISPSNIKDDKFNLEESTYISYEKYYESPEIMVFTDDIVLVKTGSTIGKTAIIPIDSPKMTINPQLVVLKKIQTDAKYLYYQTACDYFKLSFAVEQTGSSTPTISQEKIRNFPVVISTTEEQNRIVKFLDRKTAQIDQVITQKERLIELLNERRQAMIQKAVTRGLNPNVPMKDSGIDWIGEIPARWEVKRAKYLFEEVVVNTKTGKEELLSLRMNIGLVPHNDVSDIEITDTNLIGYKIVEVGQMVMNRMRASIGLFGIANQHGLVSPDYAVYEVSNDVCPSYYLTLFKTSIMGTVFRLNSKGLGTGSSGFMRIYSENFGNIKIQVPHKEEQQAISDYIEFVTSQVENGISYMETAIQKLQELKSTLINSAVTGKIKV